MEGTSFAAPTVAGGLALVLSRYPGLQGIPFFYRAQLLGTASNTVDVRVSGDLKDTGQPLINGGAAVGNP